MSHLHTRAPWAAVALPPLVALDLTLEDVIADLDPGFLPGAEPSELPGAGRPSRGSVSGSGASGARGAVVA